MATALWLYVSGKQDPGSIDFPQPIPISPPGVGSGLIVTNDLGSVHVRYTTDTPNLYVTTASFPASVDLLNLGPGTHRNVPITVTPAPGIHVVKFSPQRVTVVIENVLTKHVDVVPNYIVKSPPSGYQPGSPQISPPAVNIRGPESIVSTIAQASVDIDLSGVRSTIVQLSKPLPENSQGVPISDTSRLSIVPSTVQVTVPVKEIAGYKTVPVLSPIRGEPRAGYGVDGISIEPPAITVTGLPKLLNRVSTVTTAPISVTHHGRIALRTRVRILVPRGVTPSSRYATVIVRFGPVEASSSTNIAIAPLNVAPGLAAHVSPQVVLVTVVGPSSVLQHAAREVSASVNLNGFGAGLFTFTPTVSAPRQLTVEDVYPKQVSVTISAGP